MTTNTKLDWLTASSSLVYFPDDIFGGLEWKAQEHGAMHYQRSYRDAVSSARHHCSPDHAAQGSCVVFGGDALEVMEHNFSMSADALVRLLDSKRFQATRLDYALDMLETGLTVPDVYRAFTEQKLRVPSTTHRFVSSHTAKGEGATLYFGSRESERFMRIYDKGLETGALSEGRWLRVELEVKGKRAKASWERILTFGTHEEASAQIAAFLAWDNPHYQSALEGRTAPPPVTGERPVTNRRRWLLGQVVTSFAKELTEDPHFFSTFEAAVRAEFSQ